MRILLLHNYYQYAGGEDSVFASESALLRSQGHEVIEITADSRDITSKLTLGLAANTVWAGQWQRRISRLLSSEKFDVVHVHNFFPLISPSVYAACNRAGLPVVQTLHNYRLICPSAMLFRDGAPCQDCVGREVPWPGVVHGCYRDSRLASGAVATMLSFHNQAGTWRKRVDQYIALTEFAKTLFIKGGLPGAKISVKPNFVHPDPGLLPTIPRRGGIFVGRLSKEKGLVTLIDAWRRFGDIPLVVVGDGPSRNGIEYRVQDSGLQDAVTFTGPVERNRLLQLMQQAEFLLLPSETYEGFPLVLAEAFACGTPVIASRRGAMAEIVEDGRTGILFDAGSVTDMADKIRFAVDNPVAMGTIGNQCRTEYVRKYSAERNYELLIEIYRRAKKQQELVTGP